jgi:hypothetical protein
MRSVHLRILSVAIATFLLLLAATPDVQAKVLASPHSPVVPVVFLPFIGNTVSLVSVPSTQPNTPDNANRVPTLDEFVHSVTDGQSNVVRGVYVRDLFALTVVQQVQNQSNYVSSETNTTTQFYAAAVFGVTGLLAHNDQAGLKFFDLATKQEIDIVYGDGTIRRYQVKNIDRFQALEPVNPQSDLIDLSTGNKLTSSEVFSRFYMGEHHLTFQTCIASTGISSWGRLFVRAEPLP